LQQNGELTSQQARSLFDEYIEKTKTREGYIEIYTELELSLRTAPDYAQQIKDFSKQSGNTFTPMVP
jgi:polyhydroxyalkanoate synthesis regulator phasin